MKSYTIDSICAKVGAIYSRCSTGIYTYIQSYLWALTLSGHPYSPKLESFSVSYNLALYFKALTTCVSKPVFW